MDTKNKINEKVLDTYINRYSQIFNNEITTEEIKERLLLSGFNGIYIIPEDEFRKSKDNKNLRGKYLSDKKIILTYHQDELESVIMHELTHALLQSCFLISNNIDKETNLDVNIEEAGYGIEEGVAGLVGTLNNKNNNLYEIIHYESYSSISHIVQMLNLLYEDYRDKLYSSILIEIIKNPNKSLFLIRDIIDDIIEQKFPNYNNDYGYSPKELKNLSYKIAYDIIKGTDYLKKFHIEKDKTDTETLQNIYSYLNLLIGNLYALRHENINMGKYHHTEIERNVFGEKLIRSMRVATKNTISYILKNDNKALKEEAEAEYLERLFEISGFMTMFIDYEEFPTKSPRM